MKQRIKATYLAGLRENVGKYYYGETWMDKDGQHFRIKYGKKIRTDKPWSFEFIEKKTSLKSSLPKGYKKAIKDKLAKKGISREWMSKHLEII